MQQTPISAKTRAPPSKQSSFVTGSLNTAAVNPTPDEPLPVVYIPLGEIDEICFNSYDLATPGSPFLIIFKKYFIQLMLYLYRLLFSFRHAFP